MASDPSQKSLQSEVTPEKVYVNRRAFIQAGVAVASVVATGALYRAMRPGRGGAQTKALAGVTETPSSSAGSAEAIRSGFFVDEPQTSYQDITHYNNFYEFTTNKEAVAEAAAKFDTTGWKVEVGGLVRKPQVFDLDDLRKLAPLEQRVYRMRCVEAWSMVIPWDGYSLSRLLERVEPLSSAHHVAFTTLVDPKRMPGQRTATLNWPYVEGLRMDEAMHPLAILAMGIYGRELPPQDGAPVRLVAPWKYGFKGIKSIVKIDLVEQQPPTTWSAYGPNEYGYYGNVNPHVDHPRWSQASEERIGTGGGRRPTLMFNGYADQVASLYSGMDLKKYF